MLILVRVSTMVTREAPCEVGVPLADGAVPMRTAATGCSSEYPKLTIHGINYAEQIS